MSGKTHAELADGYTECGRSLAEADLKTSHDGAPPTCGSCARIAVDEDRPERVCAYCGLTVRRNLTAVAGWDLVSVAVSIRPTMRVWFCPWHAGLAAEFGLTTFYVIRDEVDALVNALRERWRPAPTAA